MGDGSTATDPAHRPNTTGAVSQTVRSFGRYLVSAALTAVLLAACGSGQTAEAKQLTIITTDAVLDQAASKAVAQYVEDEGTEVEIQQQPDYDAVFAELDQQTPPDQAWIGVVTARQDATANGQKAQLPEHLQVVSQAPVELQITAAASTITAKQFAQARDQTTEGRDSDALKNACAQLTWLLPETVTDEVDEAMTDLIDQGCEPEYESTGLVDIDTYDDIATQMTTEQSTVAMLYNVAPVISDLGLDTLELDNHTDPSSSLAAVSSADIDASLERDISAVLDVLDAQAATELLRGYHDAYTSKSDLHYDVDSAVSYWLAQHDLVDTDTVTDMSKDND